MVPNVHKTSKNIDNPWRRHAKKVNFGNASQTCRSILWSMFSRAKMARKQRIRNIIWSRTLLVWALGVCPALPIVQCYPALLYTPTKNGKVCEFGSLFSGVGKFCVQNKETRTWEGQCQVWTGFLLGKFPSKFHFYWRNSPVNFMGQNPGGVVGKVFPLSPVVDTPMGWASCNMTPIFS